MIKHVVRIVPKVRDKPIWFVRRASDDRIKCIDGKWRGSVSIGDIKFYSSAGRAMRYGLAGCRAVASVAGGSLVSKGSAHAVYPGESVDREGRIYDENDNWAR